MFIPNFELANYIISGYFPIINDDSDKIEDSTILKEDYDE